jgi:hypothetical protein
VRVRGAPRNFIGFPRARCASSIVPSNSGKDSATTEYLVNVLMEKYVVNLRRWPIVPSDVKAFVKFPYVRSGFVTVIESIALDGDGKIAGFNW